MEWIPVVGWEEIYIVNEIGDLCSVPRTIVRRDGSIQRFKGKRLSNYLNSAGYCVVRLSDDSKGRRMVARVHRLVAEAFIPNPQNKPEVNHIDGNKANPMMINLEWVTPKENRKHAWDTGLRNRSHLPSHIGSSKPNAKLTEEDVCQARIMRASGATYMKLADAFSVSKKTIIDAVRGVSWSHVKYPPPPTE